MRHYYGLQVQKNWRGNLFLWKKYEANEVERWDEYVLCLGPIQISWMRD